MAIPAGGGQSLSDLQAVGNAASASKKTSAQPKNLTSFSVKKGDNGGVIVSETYETKAPEGRRSASFNTGSDYKENPFSAKDGAAATSHITDLLSQMGVQGAAPEAPAVQGGGLPPMPRPAAPPRPARPPMPPMGAGPMGGGPMV